jgi:hypothetical protein
MNARIHMRRRTAVVAGGLLGTALLAVTTAVSLGGFTSTIVNPTNTFSSGTVVLQESNGTTFCDSTGYAGPVAGPGGSITAANSGNCTTIDDLGAPVNQGPGSAANTQTLSLKNVGTINGSTFTVTPAACAAVAATGTGGYNGTDTAGFCGKVNVTIFNTTTGNCVYPAGAGACPALSNTRTLSTLGTAGALSLGALNAGSTFSVVVTTQIDASATNIDQGLKATIPFTWQLNQ